MEVLNTVEVDWETIPQYMERLDQHLGVNVGNLIGHSAVRYYVMGDECQGRTATDDEIRAMQDVVRDGIKAGALGLSVSRNKGHYDPQGVHIPALWADEKEIFALGDVLREMGTGIIQSGGGRAAELKDGLMARLSEATGRTVIYNNLGQTVREPDLWKKHMARVEETSKAGIRAYPLCSPNRTTQSFTMRNCQTFRGAPTWHPILLSSDEEKLRAYADPAIRQKLHDEVVEHTVEVPAAGYSRKWYDYMWVETPALEKNQASRARRSARSPRSRTSGIIDAFLDLVVEENLDTGFMMAENNVDDEAMAKILTYPNAIVGLSDGGAHVQFHGGYGYSTRLSQRVGAREARHDARARGAAADLRFRFRARPLRPRTAAPGHGGRHRDLRSRHRSSAAGKRRARLPGRRLAREGAGGRYHGDDRQRRGADGERQAHRRIARPGAAQHLLPRPHLARPNGRKDRPQHSLRAVAV